MSSEHRKRRAILGEGDTPEEEVIDMDRLEATLRSHRDQLAVDGPAGRLSTIMNQRQWERFKVAERALLDQYPFLKVRDTDIPDAFRVSGGFYDDLFHIQDCPRLYKLAALIGEIEGYNWATERSRAFMVS